MSFGRTGGLGCGGILVLLVISFIFGINPLQLLDQTGGVSPSPAPTQTGEAPDDVAGEFVSVVLASTEDVWSPLFRREGAAYRAPTLVLYDGITPTACGTGQAATGPFYCPGDQKIYLDLSFIRQLEQLGASGEFAIAYVLAHEVGHHVQNLSGTMDRMNQLRSRSTQTQANQLSVLLELQADCFAGVWAHEADEAQNLLERGDLEDGIDAAAAVGDDRLQQMAGRAVQRESFTHGSSQQRVSWFQRGYQTGSVNACDTFAEAGL